MSEKKNKILFISSADPLIGPGTIGNDYVTVFKNAGYEVDFLTKNKVSNKDEILFVYKTPPKFSNLRFRIWRKLKHFNLTNQYSFFYRRESNPPVPIKKVLKKIRKNYDYVISFFWQSLLSYKTVEAIYDKMKNKPQIIYLCADFSPMTGGCHFMGNCRRYEEGCGYCPIIKSNSPDDFTAKNMIDRVRINKKIKPLVIGNLYMKSLFDKSPAMQSGARVISIPILINLDKYKQLDSKEIRTKYGIREEKFVLLFGCQDLSDERKGMKYLLSALSLLKKNLSESEIQQIQVVTIGKITNEISEKIPFNQKNLGYVDPDRLPEIYSLASAFLSPSIDDAGPSMVNQSISCGTPVIAFEMGTAIEVVKNSRAGICVPLKDDFLYAKAIEKIFRMNKSDYNELRKKCRQTAISYHSQESFLKSFESSCNRIEKKEE